MSVGGPEPTRRQKILNIILIAPIVIVAVTVSIVYNVKVYGSLFHWSFLLMSLVEAGLALLNYNLPEKLALLKFPILLFAVVLPYFIASSLTLMKPAGSSWIIYFLTALLISIVRAQRRSPHGAGKKPGAGN